MSAGHKLALAAFWTEHPLCSLYAIAHGSWSGRAFCPAESWSLRSLIEFAETLPADVLERLEKRP